jgi:hypothetical protein
MSRIGWRPLKEPYLRKVVGKVTGGLSEIWLPTVDVFRALDLPADLGVGAPLT